MNFLHTKTKTMIKNMVELIALAIAEAMLLVLLLLLAPIEMLTEKVINLWERTTDKHLELLDKIK